MPVQFKVYWRSHASDGVTPLSASAEHAEKRTRYEIWIAKDGRYNGDPRRLRIIVPLRRTVKPPGPPHYRNDDRSAEAEAYRAAGDKARAMYEAHGDEARYIATCLADYLAHVIDGAATPPDPKLQQILKELMP